MSTIPATMKAVVIQEGHRVALEDRPVPAIGDNDVLVKTVSVAQNPTDWKHVDYDRGVPGSILGCDFSGIVVQTGKDVPHAPHAVRVGDHVAGFVHGGAFADGNEGAYAEYVRTPADLVWRVPEDTLGHDEAATFGCAFWTAVQALYHPTRLGLVEPPAKAPGDEWVFVYGGSSAVGQFAIQLLRLSGYKVVTTASPRNFALVQSLGADAVFDYRDPAVVAKVKAATGDSVTKVFDTISEAESQRICAACVAPSGGKVVILIKLAGSDVTMRTDVESKLTIVYTALGRAFQFGPLVSFPVVEEDRAHMAQFLRKVPALVKNGSVRPPAVRLWEGGLAGVPDGLQYMREGRVSGEKIVYRV